MTNFNLEELNIDGKKQGLNNQIYSYLKDKIITLEYKPGDKINMIKLADELNVSRTPIKSAIDLLCADRLVSMTDSKTYIVSPVNFLDCLNLADSRKIIEGTAAKLAATHITSSDLETLEANIALSKTLLADKKYSEYAKVDRDYHELLLHAANNPYLLRAYSSIKDSLLRYRYIVSIYCVGDAPKDTMQALTKHICIFKAIKNHYSTIAQDEMAEHITYSYKNLFSLGLFCKNIENN